jgi:hypothetical protein
MSTTPFNIVSEFNNFWVPNSNFTRADRVDDASGSYMVVMYDSVQQVICDINEPPFICAVVKSPLARVILRVSCYDSTPCISLGVYQYLRGKFEFLFILNNDDYVLREKDCNVWCNINRSLLSDFIGGGAFVSSFADQLQNSWTDPSLSTLKNDFQEALSIFDGCSNQPEIDNPDLAPPGSSPPSPAPVSRRGPISQPQSPDDPVAGGDAPFINFHDWEDVLRAPYSYRRARCYYRAEAGTNDDCPGPGLTRSPEDDDTSFSVPIWLGFKDEELVVNNANDSELPQVYKDGCAYTDSSGTFTYRSYISGVRLDSRIIVTDEITNYTLKRTDRCDTEVVDSVCYQDKPVLRVKTRILLYRRNEVIFDTGGCNVPTPDDGPQYYRVAGYAIFRNSNLVLPFLFSSFGFYYCANTEGEAVSKAQAYIESVASANNLGVLHKFNAYANPTGPCPPS